MSQCPLKRIKFYSYSKGFQTNCPKNCLKVFVQKLPSIISREQQWTKPACESLPSLLLLAQRGQKQKMLPSLTIIQQQKHRLLFWKEWEEVKEQVAGGNKTQYTNTMQSGRPWSRTLDRFHSSWSKLQNKSAYSDSAVWTVYKKKKKKK